MALRINQIIDCLSFLFVPRLKYWKETFYLWVIYTIFVVLYCYSSNFQNNQFERKTGVIDEIYFLNLERKYSFNIIYNFKIEGDTTRYGQKWLIQDWFALKYFLFGERRLPRQIRNIQPGDTIEFYVNKETENFPTFLWNEDDKITGQIKTEVKTISNSSIVSTYGMKINNNVLMDFHKRTFVKKIFSIFFIFELLFFIFLFPIFLMYLSVSIFAFPAYIRKYKHNTPHS